MPALHQEPDDKVVVGKIKEVLEQRIGTDRFGLWFADRVRFHFGPQGLTLEVDGEFALERLRGNYVRTLEAVAAEVLQRLVPVRLQLAGAAPLVLADADAAEVVTAEVIAAAPASSAEVIGMGPSVLPGSPVPSERFASGAETAEKSTRGGVAGRPHGGPAPPSRGPATFADLLAATAPRLSEHPLAPTRELPPGRALSPTRATEAPAPAAPRAIRGSRRGAAPRLAQPARQVNQRSIARPSQIVPAPAAAGSPQTGVPRKSIRVTTATANSEAQPAVPHPAGNHRSGGAASAGHGNATAGGAAGGGMPQRGEPMTFGTFATAASNTLAITAAQLLTADPANAAPLCLWGATGTGKTHLLWAIRHALRAQHRLPRVILLSAEEFTNDFLSCVRGSGLPAFRKRYRDVDALLIDNVQFLGGKSATLREMLYTVDTVLSRRRPLVLASDRQPLEIEGLSAELAGRMSSGLVCGINPMELELRRELFSRHARRSFLPWDDATIDALAERTVGDGRVIQGVAQLVSMLQRMYRRMPTLQEITTHAGDMLQRGPKSVALADVERAVCTAFGLSAEELKSDSKSRSISQPRILAMYLSRQHTTAAYAEIGRYYGDRNHSTVIAANRRVESWLKENQSVGGRGPKGMRAQEAIAAVENLLRIG